MAPDKGWDKVIRHNQTQPHSGWSSLATCKYLAEYPSRNLGGVCFLHNVVTDLMLGWESEKGIECFARAIRKMAWFPVLLH